MSAAKAPAYHEALELEICLATGKRRLIGDPPPEVVWSWELIDMLRANPGEWATIETTSDGHEVITLHVEPEPVTYALVGGDPDGVLGKLIKWEG